LAMGRWALMVSDAMIALTTVRRKVIAVDADNTLWGGVLGEEGWAGLSCDQNYPGNVYLRIQERLLGLKASGLLLVLLSKNDEELVTEAFQKHPGFRLGLDDFIEIHCNYEDKHVNLQKAAQNLGLGTDSFAFFDDHDVEREKMRTYLPEVLVLNSDSEPLAMLGSLEHPELKPLHSISDDSHLKYRQRQDRIQAERKAPSREEFLAGLEIRYLIQPLDESLLPRAHQLCQKTNQFNLTTHRHGEAKLRAWMTDPRARIFLLKAEDRFGEQGWVAMAIAHEERGEKEWLLDTFLMSCRVLGKDLELALMAHLVLELRKLGVTTLIGQFIPTPRNEPCASFLPAIGFEPLCHEGLTHRSILHLSGSSLTCPQHLRPTTPT